MGDDNKKRRISCKENQTNAMFRRAASWCLGVVRAVRSIGGRRVGAGPGGARGSRGAREKHLSTTFQSQLLWTSSKRFEPERGMPRRWFSISSNCLNRATQTCSPKARKGTTGSSGGGKMGYLSISFLIDMPAIAHSSCRCVGELGGVTMSQSRLSCGAPPLPSQRWEDGEEEENAGESAKEIVRREVYLCSIVDWQRSGARRADCGELGLGSAGIVRACAVEHVNQLHEERRRDGVGRREGGRREGEIMVGRPTLFRSGAEPLGSDKGLPALWPDALAAVDRLRHAPGGGGGMSNAEAQWPHTPLYSHTHAKSSSHGVGLRKPTSWHAL